MGQIGKGGTRVGLGVGVLEHQRWTGFSRRSLLRYLHNYRSGIFQNREDWCIRLGLFTLQFVWQFGPGLWCGRGEWGIIPRRSSEQRLVHIWLDNSTTTRGYTQAWAKDVRCDKDVISLIELVKDFKERYREMGILKGDKSMNFATLNGRPQQSSSPATFGNCIYGARHRYAQCYYLNPSRKPPGWKENGEKRTQIDQALKNQGLKRRIDRAISRDSSMNTDMVDANEAVLGGMVLKQSDPQSINPQSIDHQSTDHQSIDQQIRKISMNSSNSRSYLRNSWIFDTGAEQHICNNRTRFLSFTPANAEVYTGDSSTKVEGYGTVRTIMINEAGKQFNVNLTNAAYIPNFHTNMLALTAVAIDLSIQPSTILQIIV
ncbi:uncharacterized protein BDCG_16081 [Blastomyces dermatitidis ER-3]|uniref:Retrovirus-related Pol polyprotein from transposon TNT 1-94-like beta-barrel domain-containing protein n=1 Tax=Ajellomyces dermatitidis (strain ER-3 / ATCC MYA-2586) TaxID=559297 RepID=A0ABX2VQ36_AJEDR|nr:uncharacterized protein BDCG_16081 [Blastomyces dermatitidis ER-3]OAS99363.1 hypothetical protein BDCG_16081 [Blastomyces dermatitidis ER-3]